MISRPLPKSIILLRISLKIPLEGQRVAWSRGLIFPSLSGHGILQSNDLLETENNHEQL
jgi:hypothetical protein